MKKPTLLVGALFTGLAMLLVAEPAFACSVCFDANEQTRGAFLGTTVFLSLLPLGMIFGTIFWLWRRSKAMALEETHPTQA